MQGEFTKIYLQNDQSEGKYTMDGASGYGFVHDWWWLPHSEGLCLGGDWCHRRTNENLHSIAKRPFQSRWVFVNTKLAQRTSQQVGASILLGSPGAQVLTPDHTQQPVPILKVDALRGMPKPRERLDAQIYAISAVCLQVVSSTRFVITPTVWLGVFLPCRNHSPSFQGVKMPRRFW